MMSREIPSKVLTEKSRLILSHSYQKFLDTVRNRILVAGFVYVFALVIVLIRLFDLMVLRSGEEPAGGLLTIADSRMARADIQDRRGEILATTISTISLYANAKQIMNPKEAVEKLLTVLPRLSKKETLRRLNAGRTFIWIARHLTPSQQKEVLNLGIPGLGFMPDFRRIYPQGRLAAHAIGFTDIDNVGISGVEKGLNDRLTASSDPLQLSLDLRLQHIARDELYKGIEEFQAAGGCSFILDIKTGEILAMVSLPDFDPNHPIPSKEEEIFNKVTLGIYEMGSTMKVANTAMALEAGIPLTARFDATKPIAIGRFKITDFRGKNDWLTLPEVFMYSSNIGSAKMALQAGSQNQRTFLKKIGLLDQPRFEIPEVGSPILPVQWSEAARITMSYGYGISISPLQLVSGIATILGGDGRVQPTLLKVRHGPTPSKEKVVSEKTSRTMLELMRLVVKEGTARKADVAGYFVFAKTGTSNLRRGRSYQKDKVMTNFVGILGKSAQEPAYVIYVMLEDPKRLKKTFGFNAAGWNAAPIGGRIIERIAPLLGYEPYEDDPGISNHIMAQLHHLRKRND